MAINLFQHYPKEEVYACCRCLVSWRGDIRAAMLPSTLQEQLQGPRDRLGRQDREVVSRGLCKGA